MSEEGARNPMGNSPDGSLPRLRFSPRITVLCLVVCFLGLSLVVWSTSLSERPVLPPSASRDLERLADRLLTFETHLSHLSLIEQQIYQMGSGEVNGLDNVLNWYRELVAERTSPLSRLYMGVLLGESGAYDELRKWVSDTWKRDGATDFFQEVLRGAYLKRSVLGREYLTIQSRLAEDLPGNWFYFQLAKRLAERAGDHTFRSALENQVERAVAPLVWRWRASLLSELLMIGAGLFCVILFIRGRIPDVVRARQKWSFEEGLAILARGGALTVLCIAGVAVWPGGPAFILEYGFLILYAPIILVAYFFLFRSRIWSVPEVFGWSDFPYRLRSTFPIVLIVLALGLLGDWLIISVGDAIGYSVHWTEWFVPELVWGQGRDMFKTGVEFVILAPLFEEIIFRGLVFSTFLGRFGTRFSMVGSGLLFALAHGYGLLAFLTVFWSGTLWAWAYYRTGSLIPGIIAHAVNNGIVVFSLLAFFR